MTVNDFEIALGNDFTDGHTVEVTNNTGSSDDYRISASVSVDSTSLGISEFAVPATGFVTIAHGASHIFTADIAAAYRLYNDPNFPNGDTAQPGLGDGAVLFVFTVTRLSDLSVIATHTATINVVDSTSWGVTGVPPFSYEVSALLDVEFELY